MVTSR